MLERVGVLRRGISRDGHVVYLPTDMGLGLREVVRVMSAWGERWVEPAPEHYEASMVLWELSHLLEPEDLPEGRVIVRFDIHQERRHHWLLLDHPERELRDRPLNAPDDLVVVASAEWLTEWFMGRLSLEAGRRAGLVAVTGPAALHAMLDGWEGLGSWLRPDPEAALLPAGAGSSTAG